MQEENVAIFFATITIISVQNNFVFSVLATFEHLHCS